MIGEGEEREERAAAEPDVPSLADDSAGSAQEARPHHLAPTGWATHLEKLAAARRERRRKVATRFWYTAIPVALAVILAMALLSVYGGLGGHEAAAPPPTVAAREPVEGSGLLLVEDQGVLLAAAVVQPGDQGGIVMTLPGITLLEGRDGFYTLTQLYADGRMSAVAQAVAAALAVAVGPTAVVGWSDLDAAMTGAGVQRTSADSAADESAEPTVGPAPLAADGWVEGLARELWYFMAAAITDRGSDLWYQLDMKGNAAGFLEAVVLDAGSMATNEWAASTLEGSLVVGADFTYLEPDVEHARTLLGVATRQVETFVEVRDGAGVAGAPELAGDLLESAGYSLLPMGYAEAFPEVESTQIVAYPGGAGEAERVRGLLGVGVIAEDATLETDRIVVILGKDFGQEPATESESVE